MTQRELPLGERPLRNIESFESVARKLRAKGFDDEIDAHIKRRKQASLRFSLYTRLLKVTSYTFGALGLFAFAAWVLGCADVWEFGFNGIARDYGLGSAAILIFTGACLRVAEERIADWHARVLNRMQEQEEAICRSAQKA